MNSFAPGIDCFSPFTCIVLLATFKPNAKKVYTALRGEYTEYKTPFCNPAFFCIITA